MEKVNVIMIRCIIFTKLLKYQLYRTKFRRIRLIFCLARAVRSPSEIRFIAAPTKANRTLKVKICKIRTFLKMMIIFFGILRFEPFFLLGSVWLERSAEFPLPAELTDRADN